MSECLQLVGDVLTKCLVLCRDIVEACGKFGESLLECVQFRFHALLLVVSFDYFPYLLLGIEVTTFLQSFQFFVYDTLFLVEARFLRIMLLLQFLEQSFLLLLLLHKLGNLCLDKGKPLA